MNFLVVRVARVAMMACVGILLLAGRCLAGAWTMPEGKLYERLAFSYYFADDEFRKGGGRRDFPLNGEYSEMNLGNYLEYGLTDRFTILNSFYYKNIKKDDDSQELDSNGIGDIDLGVKGKISEGPWGVASSQALVKIPEAYDEHEDLALGNGQYDVELRLLYGRSLYPLIPGYFNVEFGHRWRLGDPSDELRYLVELGMDFTRDFYGRIKLDSILGLGNGKSSGNFGNFGSSTTANNYDLGKLDMALGYKITKAWGLEIAYAPEIYGKNTSAGATYTLAVTYQIK